MYSYIYPIKMGIIFFPMLALLITFPFLIYQYRKYGYINIFRNLILYSFLLYLLVTYCYIVLPLPKHRNNPMIGQAYQLMPFNFIYDFLKETKVDFHNIKTYPLLFKERGFLQVFFNTVLLMPLGIYLRYYFKKTFIITFIISFCTSLFFELTQLSALYGIFAHPYRFFDVDDLIANTLGGILGFLIAPVFIYFLPDSDSLDDNIDRRKIKVGYLRRLLSYIIDFMVLLPFLWNKKLLFIVIFLYFIVICYFTNGQTLGKAILKIRIKGANERITFKEVFMRYGVLYYLSFGFMYFLPFKKVLTIFIIGIFCMHVLLNTFKKDNRLYYEKISKTKTVSINEKG